MSTQQSSQLSSAQKYWDKHDWLEYLESTHPADIEMGLGRVTKVAQALDLFKPANITIVVGGTNGKGTTTALLGQLLAEKGLTSGCYNSPHIHQYNERVNRRDSVSESLMTTDEELCQAFQAIEQGRGEIPLTYFEFGTLAALWQIKHWQVDVALLEVGLGGRLDAVNIVDPDLSIVTSVGLDHQDWLGDTLDQIGYEKAGIARVGKPLVCGQPDVSSGFKQEAKRIGANSLYFAEDFSISVDSLSEKAGWLLKYGQNKKLHLPKGHIPFYNMASAIVGLDQLGLLPNQVGIEQACEQTRVAGRLTRVSGHCYSGKNTGKTFEFILDVAHNEQAAGFLATQLSHCKHGVLAMLADKDPASVVESLPAVKNWYLAGLSGYRGQSCASLEQKLKSRAVLEGREYSCHQDVQMALQSVVENSTSESEVIEVLVIGSFLTVSAAETALRMIKGLQIDGNES